VHVLEEVAADLRLFQGAAQDRDDHEQHDGALIVEVDDGSKPRDRFHTMSAGVVPVKRRTLQLSREHRTRLRGERFRARRARWAKSEFQEIAAAIFAASAVPAAESRLFIGQPIPKPSRVLGLGMM